MASEDTSQNAKHRSIGSRLMMWGLGLFVTLTLYVLSVGPAFVISCGWARDQAWYNRCFYIVYWPLDALSYRWPIVNHLLRVYVDWWLQITATRR
ncbi:MAG: hypothetical protein ACYC26_14560 [Phycisphaerales bacterium]